MEKKTAKMIITMLVEQNEIRAIRLNMLNIKPGSVHVKEHYHSKIIIIKAQETRSKTSKIQFQAL